MIFAPRPHLAPLPHTFLRVLDRLLRRPLVSPARKIEQPLPVQRRQRARIPHRPRRELAPQLIKLVRRVKRQQLARAACEACRQSTQQKAIPQLLIVLHQTHRRRQPEVMPEAVQQPHAIAVNRAKNRLLKSPLHPRRNLRLANAHARLLLHLLRRTHRVRHHHEARKPVHRLLLRPPREVHNALHDRRRLAHARRRNHRDVASVKLHETVALRLVGKAVHSSSSSTGRPPCTRAHFASST